MNDTHSLAPPSAPLEVPTQVLKQKPKASRFRRESGTWLARLITFGGSLMLTAAASWQMTLILPLNQASIISSSVLNALLWLLLVLFTLTFGWISLSALSATAGLFSRRDRCRADSDADLQGKTVLLMPIYNEDAASASAALGAMGADLAKLGVQEHFEIFVLSDTDAPDIVATEQSAMRYLRDQLADTMPVWYRHRAENTERKAGNIRDFISQWGSRYDYMVVLDADSLITGETLATLVREMDADPATGLLQTLPRQYLGETLFARLQQFAGLAYGPVFARGLSAWQGDGGNYWGHNAIIRIQAFAESAGLPVLSGRRPFGGEIRSHDFVEAALIRRAGWSVRMLPDLPGSWEECPRTLMEAAVRDRRWAQGNVQHLAIMPARGLHWPNRVHMLMGVMNYLSSLLWLAMVTVGLALSTHFTLQYRQDIPWTFLPMFDFERMIGLFILTMTLLLLPKIFGLVAGLLSRQRRGETGRFKFLLSAFLELLFSVLHAPIFMLIHSQHLWEIFWGQDSGWSNQRQQNGQLSWRQLLATHAGHTLTGVAVLALLLWLSSTLLYWMLPTVIGLLLTIPLSALSGSAAAGSWLANRGILGTPEERTPPAIMAKRQGILADCQARLLEPESQTAAATPSA
ncbi:MAG: glucans biosynthesis glucosyltransferase MdoH [Natronospirillum sp.]|uniref:glucans biosynthesis glucosyltransferase MdoH n=1 Tax=Natronospirillum sp. TaxID=2812955 RepID=UPI0025D4E173|nr:glucans biosynthesis glucosyltransferase MdoH [Natronospirillum sp.]MCH8551910.1 glucans biosynthesis glucosyltransferase MdoH [Natronospirillum sp.]